MVTGRHPMNRRCSETQLTTPSVPGFGRLQLLSTSKIARVSTLSSSEAIVRAGIR